MQAASGYVHGTLKNSSMAITNMVRPVEKMALANHPVKGLYFTVVGAPQVSIVLGELHIISERSGQFQNFIKIFFIN